MRKRDEDACMRWLLRYHKSSFRPEHSLDRILRVVTRPNHQQQKQQTQSLVVNPSLAK